MSAEPDMKAGQPAPAPNFALPRSYRLLIDGAWRDATSAGVFERRSPADGRVVGRYADAGVPDMQRAIEAARLEFDEGPWRTAPGAEKARVLRAAAQLARERTEELAEIACWEVGKPLAQARGEVAQLIDALEYCAGAVFSLRGEAVTQEAQGGLGMVLYEPVGVVAAITSFNFPINLVAAKVPYALAAGCSVVLKPSELSTATAFEICKLLIDAGLPPGALHVVPTTSVDVARHLVQSALVDKVAFTGSTATGRAIMRDAAGTIKRLTLELGGKGPLLVFQDADLDAVEAAIFGSIFLMAGQVCTAGSRLLVQDSIHDEVVQRVLRVARAVCVGHPLDPAATMGPVAGEAQAGRIAEHVRWAQEDGSTLLCGGQRLTGGLYDSGFYFEPTVFDDVAPASRLAQQEVFGPVLAITRFSTDKEAIDIANGTDYGLKATVWTRDNARLLRTLKEVRAGIVMGNTATATVPQVGMPFGGYKMSGLGREYGTHGLIESFMETKSVFIKL